MTTRKKRFDATLFGGISLSIVVVVAVPLLLVLAFMVTSVIYSTLELWKSELGIIHSLAFTLFGALTILAWPSGVVVTHTLALGVSSAIGGIAALLARKKRVALARVLALVAALILTLLWPLIFWYFNFFNPMPLVTVDLATHGTVLNWLLELPGFFAALAYLILLVRFALKH